MKAKNSLNLSADEILPVFVIEGGKVFEFGDLLQVFGEVVEFLVLALVLVRLPKRSDLELKEKN